MKKQLPKRGAVLIPYLYLLVILLTSYLHVPSLVILNRRHRNFTENPYSDKSIQWAESKDIKCLEMIEVYLIKNALTPQIPVPL